MNATAIFFWVCIGAGVLLCICIMLACSTPPKSRRGMSSQRSKWPDGYTYSISTSETGNPYWMSGDTHHASHDAGHSSHSDGGSHGGGDSGGDGGGGGH